MVKPLLHGVRRSRDAPDQRMATKLLHKSFSAPPMHACEMYAYEVHAYEMNAYEVHAHEVYPHEMHARKMHAHEVHAHETHAYEIHAREMHAREVHAHETLTNGGAVVDLSRSELQKTSFCASCGVVPMTRRNPAKENAGAAKPSHRNCL